MMYSRPPVHSLKLGLRIPVGMSIPALPYLVVLIATLTCVRGLSLSGIVQIILLLVFLWLWSVVVGFYISVKLKEPIIIMRVLNITLTALTVFVPVYYPMKFFQTFPHKIILFLPTTSCAYLIHSLYEPLSEWKIALTSLTFWSLGIGVFKEELTLEGTTRHF